MSWGPTGPSQSSSDEPPFTPDEAFTIRALDALAPQYWGIEPMDRLTAQTAIRVTAILACLRFLAQSIACMPLELMHVGDRRKRPAIDLPCYPVLTRQPNGWQSTYSWLEQMVFHTGLYGNGYSKIVPGARGFCSQLVPLHPSRVLVKRMSDNTLEYTYTDAFGRTESLSQDQVVHFRWLSDNGYLGQMPADLCGTSVSLARKLDVAASAYWDNSARPDTVLETTERIPDEGMQALRQGWRDAYGGARNRGKVAILPKSVTARTLDGNSMESSQYMQQRSAIVSEIARIFGVPATLIGHEGAMKWSTVEQEHLGAQVWCLLPWQHRIESAIDVSILSAYGNDVYCKLDNRGLMRADSAGRAQLYQALWSMGAITPNEIRDLEDLPLLDNPAADETYVQLGFSTLSAAAAQAPQQAPAPVEPVAPAPDQSTTLPADAAGPFISGGDDVILG
jgi:HK97 family phage portal protein